ncbi:MAG: 4Fe-4S dicluster domain-containing protein [Chloroflexi bacterium]|nr:4Fe-4S dicluster domain-containing protein [Chloroflexota bacterium]
MNRGSSVKVKTESGWMLERKMLTRHYEFTWLRERCVGCATCYAVCPKEAIKLQAGRTVDGALVKRPGIDIDETKCVYCGECVALCPVNALLMDVNGEPENPVLRYEVFPQLARAVEVHLDRLTPAAAEAAAAACPTQVIALEGERDAAGRLASLRAVTVDESNCIYCRQCEKAAPAGFEVTMPWEGQNILTESLCPPGCHACADICPSHSLTVNAAGRVELDVSTCLFCSACAKVCPVRGAIVGVRRHIRHDPVKSSAWSAALEKLISLEEKIRELGVTSEEKRRRALRYLPGVAEWQSGPE